MKRGREEIWKGIRAREQLIRRGKQWDRGKEREREGRRKGGREGLGQGGMREETRQIVSLGQENNQRGRRERGKCQKGGRKEDECWGFG